MSTRVQVQRALLFVLIGVLVLALACARSDERASPAPAGTPAPTAAPAPTVAPAPSASAPAATPAPSTPQTAPATVAAAARAQPEPLVAGGPIFYADEVSKIKGWQILQRWHVTKLPLWERAKYGGTHTGADSGFLVVNLKSQINPLEILRLARPTTHGMLLYTESGRCAWDHQRAGAEDFSRCAGKYGKNQAIVIRSGIFVSWEQPDPVTYIFKMRKGVLWPARPPVERQDREVTAQDIAWWLGIMKEKSIVRENYKLVKSFEALDRHTVKITMESPNADFLINLAHTSAGIFPKECYEEKGCLDNKHISPGPFLLKEFVLREKAVWEKNPEFYLKGAPYWDRILALRIPDPAAQKAAYITAQVDHFGAVNLTEADGLLKNRPGGLVHAVGGIGGVSYVLRPNIGLGGPLADVRVRRAMAMTMDIPNTWEAFTEGFTVFPTLISRDYFGAEFYMSLKQAGEWYQYNPERAKQLIKEAGYEKGFSTKMLYTINSGSYYDAMIYLQAQWKKHLNIDAQIQIVDRVAQDEQFYKGIWEGMLNSSACWIRSCWGTADDAFANFVTGAAQNLAKITDPFIDQMFPKQRGELDPAKRAKLLWEFDQYELTQVYMFRIGVATSFNFMQPWEMNGAAHETMWFTAFNGPTWMGMHDTSKYPGARK